jgi:hypothetical protein
MRRHRGQHLPRHPAATARRVSSAPQPCPDAAATDRSSRPVAGPVLPSLGLAQPGLDPGTHGLKRTAWAQRTLSLHQRPRNMPGKHAMHRDAAGARSTSRSTASMPDPAGSVTQRNWELCSGQARSRRCPSVRRPHDRGGRGTRPHAADRTREWPRVPQRRTLAMPLSARVGPRCFRPYLAETVAMIAKAVCAMF